MLTSLRTRGLRIWFLLLGFYILEFLDDFLSYFQFVSWVYRRKLEGYFLILVWFDINNYLVYTSVFLFCFQIFFESDFLIREAYKEYVLLWFISAALNLFPSRFVSTNCISISFLWQDLVLTNQGLCQGILYLLPIFLCLIWLLLLCVSSFMHTILFLFVEVWLVTKLPSHASVDSGVIDISCWSHHVSLILLSFLESFLSYPLRCHSILFYSLVQLQVESAFHLPVLMMMGIIMTVFVMLVEFHCTYSQWIQYL